MPSPGSKSTLVMRGMAPFLFLAGYCCLSVFRMSDPITKFSPWNNGMGGGGDDLAMDYPSVQNPTPTAVISDTVASDGLGTALEAAPTSDVLDSDEDTKENIDKGVAEPISTKEEPSTETKQSAAPKKKFFVMHIGPSKTGTSAIQEYMVTNPFMGDTLDPSKDNVMYVGRMAGHSWPAPDQGNRVRIVNGKKIKGIQEFHAYKRSVDCMEKHLSDYYDRHNSTDRKILEKRLANDEETRSSLRDDLVSCWRKRQVVGDMSYMLEYNILDSDEGYSHMQNQNYDKLGQRFLMFDILGYERLVLVAAYRRYADWLVSSYTQGIKGPCLYKAESLDEPGVANECPRWNGFLRQRLEARRGFKKPPPNETFQYKFSALHYDNVHWSISKIVANAPSHLETKLLNFFQNKTVFDSITTELFCDALDNDLPHTCEQALQKSKANAAKKNATSSVIVNKGSTSDGAYQSIVAKGYQLGFLHLPAEILAKNQRGCVGKTRWCGGLVQRCLSSIGDRCATVASETQELLDRFTDFGKNPIVGINATNISEDTNGAPDPASVSTFKELSKHHTKYHGVSWSDTLPIICPPRPTLEALLDRSLAFEEHMLPDFAASPLGKAEHERIFWDVWLEKKKLFCWADIDRLFQNATSWEEIINDRMVKRDWGPPKIDNKFKELDLEKAFKLGYTELKR